MKIFLLSKLLGQKNDTVFRVLKNSPVFKNLSSFELRVIAKLVHLRHYVSGEYVFKQDQPAIGMYIVASGNMEFLNEDIYFNSKANQEELKRKKIKELSEGDFFGELTLVDDEAFRAYSAQAITDLTLVGFLRPALFELMETRPVIATKILYNISNLLSKEISKLVS